jgi:Zn-dependent protease
MNANLNLGRIWGIPIGLHFSWFLIFGLVSWSLAVGYFPEEYPGLATPVYWILGAVTSILFFASVLVHELAHAFVALRNKLPVRAINLFIFGGVAELTQEPRSAGAEFRIAIAGPVASLGLAALFGGLYLLDQHIPLLAAPSIWLARINLLLALFNMIPGFPLDGGRVLRAAIWWKTNNLRKATQAAGISGQVVAFGFIAVGLFIAFNGSFFNGLWLIFIGWFLQNAAASSLAHTTIHEALRGITAAQAMQREFPRVSGLTPISQLVEENILKGGQRSFLVDEDGNVQGMLTLSDIRTIPERKWRFTTIRQVMQPFDRVIKVEPATELLAALQMMDQAKVSQLPVVDDNRVLGLLSRENIFNYLRLRNELGT